MQENREKTCEERILAHLNGRVADFGALRGVSGAHDDASLAEVAEDSATRDLIAELAQGAMFETEIGAWLTASEGDREPLPDRAVEELSEAARERIYELPLAVSAKTVFRVELSTGGPADWLEVFCSGDTPLYEPAGDGEHYEVERIVYHFADWFDHAERDLSGFELEAAEDFARNVVPELVG